MELKQLFQAKYGSPKTLDKLTEHPESVIRAQVAIHGSDGHREKLLKDKNSGVVACALSGRNKEHLDAHINHPSTMVRGAVAEYGNAGHHARLMHDKESDVREKVAEHTPDEHITDHLADDHDHYVRAAVARNPNTSDRTLERLKDDLHGYVRTRAHQEYSRRNPDEWIAEDVGHMTFAAHQKVHHNIDAMMHDPDHEVRLKAASKGSKHHLDQLVNDSHPAVRGEVALRGHSDHLDKLMHDPHENVRQIVAIRGKHQHVKHLTNDSDPVVRQLASKHPSMRMNEETIIADIRTKLLES
jgi:hypothetical protein